MINHKFLKVFGFCLTLLLQISCKQNNVKNDITDKKIIITESSAYPEISVNTYIELDMIKSKIVDQLYKFLSVKDSDPRSLSYWKENDYDSYMFPYMDILSIEQNHENVRYFFKPTILEIIPIQDTSEYLIKIAFIGRENDSNYLKCIYNLIVDTKDYKFKRVLNYNTRKWDTFNVGNIEYYISPSKKFNLNEAESLNDFNTDIAEFFEMEALKVKYYSCTNTKELFEIRGFDFRHNMYVSENGGETDVYSNIIYSGINSERYDHELIHLYLHRKYFKTINHLKLIDEGLATFFGGSAGKPYLNLRNELSLWLKEDDSLDVLKYLDPYYETERDNQISYTIGALLCERAIRLKGNVNFLDMFYGKNIDEVLDYLDLNRETLKNDLITESGNKPINSSLIL